MRPRGGPLTSTPTNIITADQRSENRPPLICHSPDFFFLFYNSGDEVVDGNRKKRRKTQNLQPVMSTVDIYLALLLN